MFWAFQRNLPGRAGLISSQVFSTVLPRSAVSATGRSSTRSIFDSGTNEGVETTNRGAAEAAKLTASNAVMANVCGFITCGARPIRLIHKAAEIHIHFVGRTANFLSRAGIRIPEAGSGIALSLEFAKFS